MSIVSYASMQSKLDLTKDSITTQDNLSSAKDNSSTTQDDSPTAQNNGPPLTNKYLSKL